MTENTSQTSAEQLPADRVTMLRCQQTLAPLIAREDGLYSEAAKLVYPVEDGLVFMGYDERQHDLVQLLMEEERDWQADPGPEQLERDLRFLQHSARFAVQTIHLLRRATSFQPGLKALELGAGSGWVSWLLAQAGYDTWLCDFEPNSLSLGWIYAHSRLGPGKRIACDARLAPFADESFDVVLCKEFAHHIKDKRSLLAESNRVLKPGGTLVLVDPTKSLWSAVHHLRHPDPFLGHEIAWPAGYVRAVKSAGFRIIRQRAYYPQPDGRRAAATWVKKRSNRALLNTERPRDWFGWVAQHLLLGSLVLVATKEHADVKPPPRPTIRIIDPSQVRVSPSDRQRYRPHRELLESVARDLDNSPADSIGGLGVRARDRHGSPAQRNRGLPRKRQE